MAESALQRLIRLKKEKENGSSSLEAVQGSVSEVGSGTSLAPSSNDASSGGVVLSEEGICKDGSDLPVPSDPVVVVESALVPEVVTEVKEIPVTPPKPMSAMDRLRALKTGDSSSSFNGAGKGVIESVIKAQEKEEVVPSKPLKPRATHPIAMEMAELEQALDAQVPGFISILSQIHKKLRADPDVVTLLDDEEIAVIVAGLEKHTNVTIVAPSAIKAAKSKAKKEPVSAMDL